MLVSGPSGHGKTTLIQSFWHRPPTGFAPVLVPPLDVSEPDAIAARILAASRNGAVHDPAGALSRLLRAQSLRGARPVLLVDDLHDMPPETLATLLGLASGSRVDVCVVAAGSPGRALEALCRSLPRPLRRIEIADPWTRADAERLIARIGASLPIGAADVLAAIDVPEALRTSGGNPRLVRAALDAQMRQLNLSAVEPVIAPPEAPAPDEPASSEPVAPQLPIPATPPPPIAVRERAPLPAPPRAPPVRVAARRAPRTPRRIRVSSRTARGIAGGLVAVVALGLLVDRAPAIAAWTATTASSAAAGTTSRIAEWTAAGTREISAARQAVAAAGQAISAAAHDASASARAWVKARMPEPSDTASPPAPPPIRVAVNSDPWSHVEVDGVAAGATPLVIDLAPGPHRFRAAMADGRTVERDVDVATDRNRVVLR